MKTTVLILFSLFSFCCRAQWAEFERAWNPGGFYDSHAIDIVATNEGFTMLVSARDSSHPLPGYCLIHTNYNGVPLWSKYYCVGGGNGGLIRCEDRGYLLYGTIYDSISDLAVIKTDSLGNVMWSHRYGGVMSIIDGAVIETSDNGYLVMSTGPDPFSPVISYSLFLTKTDSMGLVQWQYEYYDSLPSKPWWHDIVECGEGGGYLALDQHDALRIDANGDIIWSVQFSALGLKRAFWTGAGFTLIGNDGSQNQVAVFMDQFGNVSSIHFYPNGPNAGLPNVQDAVRTFNGGYAICGIGTDTSSVFSDRSTLLVLDATGAMIFHKSYYTSTDGVAFGVAQDSVGSFVMVGLTSIGQPIVNTMIYFIRTDSAGKSYCNEFDNSQPGFVANSPCFNTTMLRPIAGTNGTFTVTASPLVLTDSIICFNVGVIEQEYYPLVNINPNPTDGKFVIERKEFGTYADMALTDAAGKIIFFQDKAFLSGQATATFDFNLPNGLYIVSIFSQGKRESMRLVVNHN